MAFDAASFVDLESGAVGLAPGRFARLLHFERSQMLSVLSGADATSGVPRDMRPHVTQVYLAAPHLAVVRDALVDTMVRAYQAGLAGDAASGAVPQHHPLLHAAAHAYMRLAICVMGSYAA